MPKKKVDQFQLPARALRQRIEKILEEHCSSYCMGDATDRRRTAEIVAEKLGRCS